MTWWRPHRPRRCPYDTETVLAALWDLVWAGEVTNDSLAPLCESRIAGHGPQAAPAGRRREPGRSRRGRSEARSDSAPPDRRRPRAGGRWSSRCSVHSLPPTESALARAHQLLDRYGVVTRETALGEGQATAASPASIPVLKALEDRGEARRGYFVAGLGAAQFALPGAVDRLRGSPRGRARDATPVVLAATDPAQPYGAALAWPESAGPSGPHRRRPCRAGPAVCRWSFSNGAAGP